MHKTLHGDELTSSSSVLDENLTVTQLVKKFLSFYPFNIISHLRLPSKRYPALRFSNQNSERSHDLPYIILLDLS
jgi:hypothetical protein